MMDIKRTDCVTNEDQILMQDLALEESQIKKFYSSINIKNEIEIKEEPLFTNEDCSESEEEEIEIKEEPLFTNEDFDQVSELNENKRQQQRPTNNRRGGGRAFFRGGRGRQGGRGRPQNAPVEEAEVQTATRLPPKAPTPITKPDPFKPKNTGAEPSSLKNDPFYNLEIVVEGMDMTPYNEPRSFENDFSGLLTLINGSYLALTEFDRGMRKYISESMYAYYCIVALWNRLWHITSATKGENFMFDMELKRFLPDMVLPKELVLYLDGIGNVIDNENVKVDLNIQADLDQNILNGGAQGSYGRIDGLNHINYETLPAPIIALLRIQADYMLAHGGNADWDLPANLTPLAADNADRPTENLLGWKRAQSLTDEQLRVLQGSEMVLDQVNLDFACKNIGGLPINLTLILSISNYLSSSKHPISGKVSEHIMGTIGEIGYQFRSPNDHAIDRKNIADKLSSINAVTQFPASISQMTSVYRYRMDRRYDDTYCYTLTANQVRPQGWINTKNNIFIYGYAPNWNRRLYASGYSSGKNNVGKLCRAYRTQMK